MGIDKGLIPRPSVLVADLEDVGKDCATVVLRKVLQCRLREVLRIVFAVERLLRRRNRGLSRYRWGRGSSLLAGHLHERATECDDFVVLVEGDVRNRVGEGDAVQLLLDVDVARGFTLERGADVDSIGLDTSAGLDEGRCGFLDRRIRTLGQRVVDTLPEGLYESHTSQQE